MRGALWCFIEIIGIAVPALDKIAPIYQLCKLVAVYCIKERTLNESTMKKGVAGIFREVAARFLFWRFCVDKPDMKTR